MVGRTFLLAAAALAGLAGCASADRALGPQLARARSDGLPVLIYALGVPGQIRNGTAGTAVPVYVQFVVTAPAPIQRIRFTIAAYSPRGNPVRGRDGGHLRMVMTSAGPFTPDGNYEVNSFHSRPAGFPGGDVTCVELTGVQIVYADGASDSFRDNALGTVLTPSLRRRCKDDGPMVSMYPGL